MYDNSQFQLSKVQNKLFQYKLNSTDKEGVQKNMIWDDYKQKLIVTSNYNFYIISPTKNQIEFQFLDIYSRIVLTQLISFKNVIQFATYESCNILDYDYFLNDSKETYPNQIHPRSFIINDNLVFHINDVNSQANLYVNYKVRDSWIRNNLMTGYIRIVENDLQNLLVFAIYDKEICILDISSYSIVQIDQYYHKQNIISILYEDIQFAYLLSQSQQLLTLKKKSKKILLHESTVLSQGIAIYFFKQNPNQLLFTDYSNNLKINIITFTLNEGNLIGSMSSSIIMASKIVDFSLLKESQISILLEDSILIYDILQLQIIKQQKIPIKHVFSNIKIDSINNRIFVQNKITGSLVYSFNLDQSPLIKQINTFFTDIQFDKYFIYSVTSHSANIYFRKDLQFLTNFRHFEVNYSLKRIVYLGVGYLFMVEFLNKLSVYEFSSFGKDPIQKDFIYINQFNIFKSSLSLIETDINESSYQFIAIGFSLEGIFTYTSKINQYNQQSSPSCSWSVEFQQQLYQEKNIFNSLEMQLTSQNLTLSRLSIPIKDGLSFRLPEVPISIIGRKFELSMVGHDDNVKVYVNDPLNSLNTITNLKFKKLELIVDSQAYSNYINQNKIPNSIDINTQKYPNLKEFIMKDVQLDEVQINVDRVPFINFQNITVQNSISNKNKNSLTQLKLRNSENLIISQFTIDKCNINLEKPLIEINNITNVTINKIVFTNGIYNGLSTILSLQNIDNLTIGEIFIIENIFNECLFLFASIIQQFQINILYLKNTTYYYMNQNRNLFTFENDKLTQSMFNIQEIELFQINKLTIDNFVSNSSIQFLIFTMKYIKSQLLINQALITHVSIQSIQSGIVFFLIGINNTLLKYFSIDDVQYIQLLILQELKLSKSLNFICNSITIQQSQIKNYQISQTLIQIASLDINVSELTLNKITCPETQNLIPAIQIKANYNLIIKNSVFDDIYKFNQSVLRVDESTNVIIENCLFNQITSQNTGPAINIIDSRNIKIITNIFKNNLATQGSGAIYFKNSISIIIKGNLFVQNTSQNGNGGCISIINSQFDNIQNNIFEQNQALRGSGGVVYCQDGNLTSIVSNQFLKNSAINGSGGSILLNNCDLQILSSNQFNNNTAFIGGAIRYLILKPFVIFNNSLKLILKKNNFIGNNCIGYGKDIGSYPLILDVKSSFDDDEYPRGDTYIQDVQSGYKSNNPIYLRFIDEEMREINFVDFNLFPQVIDEIQDEYSTYILQANSNEIGLLGDLKQGYNREKFAFIFDLQYSYKPNSSAKISIKSTQSLPQFIEHQTLSVQKQFEIFVDIKFRQCQVGEIVQKSGIYTLCYQCEQGKIYILFQKQRRKLLFRLFNSYYQIWYQSNSLENFSKIWYQYNPVLIYEDLQYNEVIILNQNKIFVEHLYNKPEDDIIYFKNFYLPINYLFYIYQKDFIVWIILILKIKQVVKDVLLVPLTVKNGYWRENDQTDIIVYCYQFPQSCKPEDNSSKMNCIEGHVGPLCLECDIEGKVWGEKYGKGSESDCFNCSQFNSFANMSILVLIFIFIFLQVLGKVKKKQQETQKFVIITTLKKLGLRSACLYKQQTKSTSLLKILMNYFQFLAIFNSLEIKISQFSTLQDLYSVSGGDTSKNTINRLDCLIFTYQTNIPIYVLKVLWINMQPLIIFFCVEIATQLSTKNKSPLSMKYSIYTNLIILFQFYQPTITKVLSQSFSCRNIGGKRYIVQDLQKECLTDEHTFYLIVVFLPLTLFWVLMVPLFLFQRLNHYKHEFHSLKILYSYSYLYIEYRQEKFYWDIIRILMKSLTIIVINVINYNITFQSLVLLGLIFSYLFLSSRSKPYQEEKLNELDKESCYTVIITLYLIFLSEFSNNSIVQFIILIFLFAINSIFLLKMLKLILIRPINPIESERTLKEKIFFFLKSKSPQLFFWIEVAQTNKTNVFRNWNKIRKVFQSISKIKQSMQDTQNLTIIKQMKQIDEFNSQKIVIIQFKNENFIHHIFNNKKQRTYTQLQLTTLDSQRSQTESVNQIIKQTKKKLFIFQQNQISPTLTFNDEILTSSYRRSPRGNKGTDILLPKIQASEYQKRKRGRKSTFFHSNE